VIILLMGVSGSGKTTVGQLLAAQLGWHFADADDFHSAANIEKMRRGIPLTDADRAPWLATLRKIIEDWIHAGASAVLACSALKQSYRDNLNTGPEVRIVYLKGTPQLLRQRMLARHGHFMTEPMLASQLGTLEEPPEKDALILDIAPSPTEIVAQIRRHFHL
jgi:gluconokinase